MPNKSPEPDPKKVDELLDQAIAAVRAEGHASASLLQRALGIGYGRASRILDQMEAAGVIGPFQPGKPREVIEGQEIYPQINTDKHGLEQEQEPCTEDTKTNDTENQNRQGEETPEGSTAKRGMPAGAPGDVAEMLGMEGGREALLASMVGAQDAWAALLDTHLPRRAVPELSAALIAKALKGKEIKANEKGEDVARKVLELAALESIPIYAEVEKVRAELAAGWDAFAGQEKARAHVAVGAILGALKTKAKLTPVQVADGVGKLITYIKKITDQVERELCLGDLAKRSGVSVTNLRSRLSGDEEKPGAPENPGKLPAHKATAIAEEYVRHCRERLPAGTAGDGPGIIYHRECWYRYLDGIYIPAPDKELKAQLTAFIRARHWHHTSNGMVWDGPGEPTTQLAGNVMLNLSGAAVVTSEFTPPCWVNFPPAAEGISSAGNVPLRADYTQHEGQAEHQEQPQNHPQINTDEHGGKEQLRIKNEELRIAEQGQDISGSDRREAYSRDFGQTGSDTSALKGSTAQSGNAPAAGGWVLSLDNGLLDLDELFDGEGEPLGPHSVDFFTLNRLPFAYDREASAPKWQEFLERVLPEPELRGVIQEWFGYCLVPSNDYQAILVIQGEGANGKSVLMSILRALIGAENSAAVDIEALTGNHATEPLVGKLVNFASEWGHVHPNAVNILKRISGGDTVQINPKGRKAYEAIIPARFVISTNEPPRITDRSAAIWRRLLTIPFRVTIPEEERKPQEIYVRELCEELPGILLWALQGLYRLRERGRFDEPELVRAVKRDYREDANPAATWLEENMEFRPGGFEFSKRVYKEYRQAIIELGFQPLNETHFGREVGRWLRSQPESPELVRKQRLNNFFMRRERTYEDVVLTAGQNDVSATEEGGEKQLGLGVS